MSRIKMTFPTVCGQAFQKSWGMAVGGKKEPHFKYSRNQPQALKVANVFGFCCLWTLTFLRAMEFLQTAILRHTADPRLSLVRSVLFSFCSAS